MYRFFDGIWQTKESEEGVRFLLEEEGGLRVKKKEEVKEIFMKEDLVSFNVRRVRWVEEDSRKIVRPILWRQEIEEENGRMEEEGRRREREGIFLRREILS